MCEFIKYCSVRNIGRKKPNKGVRSDYKILRSKRLIEKIYLSLISPELSFYMNSLSLALQTQLREELELMATIRDSLTTPQIEAKDEITKQD